MKNHTYAITSLVAGIWLSGCSDQGYVTVRIEPRSTTDVSRESRSVTTLAGDPSYLEGGPDGSRHLLVTVTEVNVKVKAEKADKAEKKSKKPKNKPKTKHKGTCNEGDEAGAAHDDDTDQNAHGENEDDGDNNDNSDDSESDDDSASSKSKTKHQNWTQIFSGHEQVDLLAPGSVARFVAVGDVPAGRLKEIRLVLSDDVTLVANGMSSAVRCPSCSRSGFKIKTHGLAVIAGESIELSLDLSHALRGDASGYVLHPVIHLGKASCGDDGEGEDDHNIKGQGGH